MYDPIINGAHLDGRSLTPPFVEPHVHLDTTLTAGDSRRNEPGTLFEGIRM